MEDENKKMKEILTPEQNEKYLKLQAERRGGGKRKKADDNK
jgi:Spy/CpxP family protein refolding chaperone